MIPDVPGLPIELPISMHLAVPANKARETLMQ